MNLMTITTVAATALLAGTSRASPPAQAAEAPAAPAVELRMDGKLLRYTYDLTGMFDAQLWEALERNRDNEITIEVRLLDAGDNVRVTQYHRLRIELLEGGRLRVGDAPRSVVYKSRAAMLAALNRVPGKPIRAEEFAGSDGHLEVVVLVNPVQVYSFPDEDAPVAERKVVPQTFFDRKHELRSRTMPR